MGFRFYSRFQGGVDYDHLDSSIGLAIRILGAEITSGHRARGWNLVAMDDFTTKFWKMGFSRIKVEINSFEPLKPGVFIHG